MVNSNKFTGGRLFIPMGYMHKKANIADDPHVLITLGSSKVKGLHGAGAVTIDSATQA